MGAIITLVTAFPGYNWRSTTAKLRARFNSHEERRLT